MGIWRVCGGESLFLIIQYQVVSAPFLASGVFDKPPLFELEQAPVHRGLRIGRVGLEFRGAAAGVLPDVAEHGVELPFRRDRQTSLALSVLAVCPPAIRGLLACAQVLLNGGGGMRVSLGVQIESEGRFRPGHVLHDKRLPVARGDVLEWDHEGAGYADKLIVPDELDQILDGAKAGVFNAAHRIDIRLVPVLLAIEDVVNGYVLAVVAPVANIKHSGILTNDPDLRFQRLPKLFPLPQHIGEEVEGEVAAEDHEQELGEIMERPDFFDPQSLAL